MNTQAKKFLFDLHQLLVKYHIDICADAHGCHDTGTEVNISISFFDDYIEFGNRLSSEAIEEYTKSAHASSQS